ncbi:MAG TPA: helix-turn-helix domain-containing protein, partial [Burkholderiaceae bacterium]|nr:helix-turn-helix domain-containing protein [Burkholderiaceae bacterium]
MIEQTDTEQADPVLKTTSATTAPEARHEAAAPLGKPAAVIQPELAAGVEPLVRARQALGLGASDIAAKLGMATRQIEALERGDWQALPGQAFVRAALRSYGKSVGVDVAPLLAAIGGQVAAPELRSSASLDAAMPHRGTLGFGGSSGGSGGRLIWIVLGVAAVIAMALYFGDAFEIGRSTGGEESVAVGGDARSSAGGMAAGGTASPGMAASGAAASGAAAPGAGSASAGASGGPASSGAT